MVVLPPRSSAAFVAPQGIKPKPTILSWTPIAAALNAVQISEAWLAAHPPSDLTVVSLGREPLEVRHALPA
jgi:hypothetical protein